MVIDFHAHIYPGKIAEKAVQSTWDFYHIPIQKKGTAADLLESCRTNGGDVDRFVVFSAAALPGQVASINTFIAEESRKHLEFSGFGTLHPDLPRPEEEIERIIALGLKGVKLHPDMQRFNIDDERMTRVYACLEKRLPVIFHTGDYRYSFSRPERLARVLDRFPGLTAVAAHFGGWSIFDLALEYFRGRRCYLDVSSSLPYLGKQRTEELIRAYGAERVLFGSDYPMWNPDACLRDFMELNLSSREQELILSENALTLLQEQT